MPPQHRHGPVMPSPARVLVGWNPARREAATLVATVQGVLRGAPSCGAFEPRAARDIAGVRRVQPMLGLRATPTGRLRHPERLSGHAGSRRVCPRVWWDRAGFRPRCGVLRGVVVAGLAAARARRRPASPYASFFALCSYCALASGAASATRSPSCPSRARAGSKLSLDPNSSITFAVCSCMCLVSMC